MRSDLSILLLTNGTKPTLGAALASVAELGCVVAVIDPDTPPAARTLLARHKATIVERKLDTFAAQRNAGLNAITTPWTLMLDDDETVTPALAAAITATLTGQAEHVVYQVRRRNHVFGQWLAHGGWYPDWQPRLYRTKGARYEAPVHEVLVVKGSRGRLEANVEHQAYDSIDQYLAKLNHYTTFEADVLDRAGKRFSLVYFLGRPFKEFWMRFVVAQGFRDGPAGLIIALFSAVYRAVAIAKLWERHSSKERG